MSDSPVDIIAENDEASIAPAAEMFPTAFAPNARTAADVLAAWKERGWKPVEVTEERVLQRITIVHNPLKTTNQLTWTTDNLDGLGATLLAMEATLLMPCILTADAAVSIAEYFTRGDGRLDIGTGEAGVVIAFKDGRLSLDWFPKDGPAPKIAVKKLVACSLLWMIAEDAGLPIERLLRVFGNESD